MTMKQLGKESSQSGSGLTDGRLAGAVLTPSAQSAGNVQFASVTTGNKLVINFYAE